MARAELRCGRAVKSIILFVFVVFWLICGLAGAWRLDDMRAKTIARGPIVLAKAFNDKPVTYPGP
jgi:hypothetical protein